jgi:hypothetical protein
MRKKAIKPKTYQTIDDFPYKISAHMIQDSYIGYSAVFVRQAVLEGKFKGIILRNHCYMTKDQLIENFGDGKSIKAS